jgi:hypothetical protein
VAAESTDAVEGLCVHRFKDAEELPVRRFKEGEELPGEVRSSKGIRQRQVEAFIASGDKAWQVNMCGVKFPDRVHTAIRGAIRSLGVSGVYPQIRAGQVYLVRGEPDYADRRRRAL